MKYIIMTINIKNNAKSLLFWDLNIWDQYFYCKTWEWGIFPLENFFVTLEELNFEKKVIKRMILKINNRDWDKFYIWEYSAEFCVQNDILEIKKYTKDSLSFNSWANISLYFTAWMFEFLRDKNLEKQNNLSDLSNVENARQNLDVYSKSEVYNKSEVDDNFVNLTLQQNIAWKKVFNSSIWIWANPNWNLDNWKAIVLWDDWTWIKQDWTWVLQVFTNNEKIVEITNDWVFLEKNQAENPNSLTKKSYVDREIDKKVALAQNKANWRSPRVDIILYW